MEQIIITILFLQLINFIGDYPLQGDFLGVYKSKYEYLLFVHCFIWTGVLSCSLVYLGIFAWWKLIFLFIGHYIIDRWKCRHKNKEEEGLTKLLWIDQGLHFIQIILVGIA